MKCAAHVLHAPVTWIASRVHRFIFLRFFHGRDVLLLFDQRILTLRRGGFLVWLRRGVLVLRRWLGVLLGRWRWVPVPFGGPRPVLEIRLRFHGVIPRPLLTVPRCMRLLLVLLLPVRRTSPVRRALRRVLQRILRHWRQIVECGHWLLVKCLTKSRNKGETELVYERP